ncbi:hypothetical protein, partial [Rhodoferax sp.]|uniref:hypothetical protein n=1 Tax=Rhodoferax sp. TaxID=50421 RepID=UPI0026030493
MKVIITIGCPHSGYETVVHTLTQAGITNAQHGIKSGLSPQALQSRLLSSHEVDLGSTAALAQVQPGKLWNELATDLFLANLQHAHWGWADPQSVVLMDFWHDFDAQVRLLLVYNSPTSYLQQVLGHQLQPTVQSVASALDDWTRWNTALLRYLHRHPDYCVLINSQQLAAHPHPGLQALASHWQISDLHGAAASPADQPDFQHLQAHLISQMIDPLHPAWALHQELEGAALISSAADATLQTQAIPTVNQAWSDWSE